MDGSTLWCRGVKGDTSVGESGLDVSTLQIKREGGFAFKPYLPLGLRPVARLNTRAARGRAEHREASRA